MRLRSSPRRRPPFGRARRVRCGVDGTTANPASPAVSARPAGCSSRSSYEAALDARTRDGGECGAISEPR